MDAKHVPIANADDGDLVLVDWPQDLNFGIKVSGETQNYVCVFGTNLHDLQGPVLWPFDEEQTVVTFGSDWHVDFEPSTVAYHQGNRPPLGSLLITSAGPTIVCHGQAFGNGGDSVSGEIVIRPEWYQPSVGSWRIVLRHGGDEYREVFSWPPDQQAE